MDALLAAGATAEQIVALVKADMAEREAKLEARREKDADRQRRKRSRGVTRTERDTTPNGSPKDIYQTPSLTPASPSVISNEITPPTENDNSPVLKPEHVVEAWNEMAARTGLPSVRKLTPDRVKALHRRIKENTIQDFTEAIDAIERSPFLRGDSKRGWRADFDFLLSPTKFNRILEGTYGQ